MGKQIYVLMVACAGDYENYDVPCATTESLEKAQEWEGLSSMLGIYQGMLEGEVVFPARVRERLSGGVSVKTYESAKARYGKSHYTTDRLREYASKKLAGIPDDARRCWYKEVPLV